MKKVLCVTPARCIDCKKCQVACASKNHGSYEPLRSRIHVVTRAAGQGTPVVCLQCEEPACRKACPTGALGAHNELGAIELDPKRCVKCMACVAACPFGNLQHDPQSKTVQKCDLCGGEPACAVFCPTRALEYLDVAASAGPSGD